MLLASGSPRRREMLEALGFPLVVRAVDADETLLPGEAATAYLERVVLAKLDLALRLSEANAASCVLVADTIVIARPDETPVILGKPRDDADAQNMIKILSGAIHEVATRFALVMKPVDANLGEAVRTVCRTVTTRVEFRSLDDAAIERYVATGEGRDKAGSYALQGVGATLVRRIEGSHSNVIGLPLCEVVEALERFRAEAGS
ncbi:MAG: septum formation protein Maf [Myxococcales bacterium]|nr:septum formation protein Maf [Myxococcales bacterium]